MGMNKNLLLTAAILATMSLGTTAANASTSWTPFVIRNANGTNDVPTYTENVDGVGLQTSILEAGQKVGYGTSAFDGQKLSALQTFSYDRSDAGSGIPYLNIWVTDGTNYALISPVAHAYNGVNGGYDSALAVNGQNMQSMGFNIYDNSAGANFDWLVSGGHVKTGPNSFLNSDNTFVTLAQIGSLTIESPGSAALSALSDTGAPKAGFGFNLIFGDIQGNFVQPIPYNIDNIDVGTTVPLPAAFPAGVALLGLCGLAELRRRRRSA